ncbi:MAG: O-antigen ligase domain-containing protein [Betaproteobacteria bacterium]|nr:O-antigen ligase domain-containing protein [Betaproteobacteria bacterium]
MVNSPFNPRLGLLTCILCWLLLQWNLPNLGNNLTPRNMFVGAMMCIICAASWSQVFVSRQISWQGSAGCLFIPSLFVLLHAANVPTGSFPHYPWLSAAVLAIFACLVIGLAQVEYTDKNWCKLSQILTAGTTLLCLVTLTSPKYLDWPAVWLSLPLPLRAAEGGFQQPNLLASFMATSLIYSLWLHVKQSSRLPVWQISGLIFMTLVHALVIFKSGSRVGMLGLTLAMILFSSWVIICKPHNRSIWWWAVAGMLMGILLAVIFGDVLNRLHDLKNGLSTTSRLSFIKVCIFLWQQAPWWGHGIGKFSELFTPAFVQMVQSGEPLEYIHNLGHPHNEVLLWAVETGAFGVVCVAGPWIFFLTRMAHQSGLHSLGWLACLTPIGLHQFTEFPFHSSAVHIWLWAMVIAAGVPPIKPHRVALLQQKLIPCSLMALIWALTVTLVIYLSGTGWLSYQAWALRKPWPTSQVEMKTQAQEDQLLNHFLLSRSAKDHRHIAQAHYWLSNRDQAGFNDWCMAVFDLGKRKQNPQQWEFEQQCLITLGQSDALNEHQLKLKALGMQH